MTLPYFRILAQEKHVIKLEVDKFKTFQNMNSTQNNFLYINNSFFFSKKKKMRSILRKKIRSILRTELEYSNQIMISF